VKCQSSMATDGSRHLWQHSILLRFGLVPSFMSGTALWRRPSGGDLSEDVRQPVVMCPCIHLYGGAE